ncbi:MAG TPA: M20/M25/M40 family metallo-hydrolase [Pyrinomonadaceae bacterium]|nr:M20/M25/M40 family metallo-hydrolase [Pyrinomonadaceae bacterium]
MLRRQAAATLLALALFAPQASAAAALPGTPARPQQPAAPAPQAAPTPQATPASPAPQSAPAAQATPTPRPTPLPEALEKIRDEAVNRSQLMQTLSYLTDVIGPRLTGSPAMKRANNWTRDKLTEWGLENARLEPWGPFGRGWTLRRFSAEVTAPQAFPLLAYPRAWSPGLDAPLQSEVLLLEADNDEQLQKYRGQLRGRIVLAGAVRELRPRFEPPATRLTDKQLLDFANAPDPALAPPRQQQPTPEQIERFRFNERRTRFFADEGVGLLVVSSPAGDGGMLQFVQAAVVPYAPDTPPAQRTGPWDPKAPKPVPQIALSNDHYNRLVRMVRQGERPVMSVNLQVEFDDSDPSGYNTVAEIPGTDLKDEVVMLGAHMDSWHTATGATDNAAGVSVMMEAVRILKAAGLRPRRTVRVALWSGEEQGLLGSRHYVREHFGPVATPTPAQAAVGAAGAATPATNAAQGAQGTAPAPRFKPGHEKLNVYYNLDSGTGAVRGIYLQGNEALRPIFRQWLTPLADLKVGQNTYSAQTITLANAGGSDFLAFDALGLVGLDFLQDEIEYDTRTWHSNQDNYDRVIPEDLRQAAIVVAWFVYNSAIADQKLPRKPFRAPRP